MHVQLTVVVVVISSVTTFSVSTTEMYPRRLAMAKAVLPFWREERGGERAEREGGLWCEPMRSLSTLHEPAFPSKTRHSLGKSQLFYCYIWLCLCNFFKTIAPIAMETQHTSASDSKYYSAVWFNPSGLTFHYTACLACISLGVILQKYSSKK